MERWYGRVALVTGASSGIGAEICKILVKNKMQVVGCARRMEKLQSMKKDLEGEDGKFFPHKCDLEVEQEILDMFQWIRDNLGGVDVCVNCAGFNTAEDLLEGDVSKWRSMLNVNVLALTICTKETLKIMKEREVKDGHIININSILGHKVANLPCSSFYSGTKHAVTAITEALRLELRRSKRETIKVTSISPGTVNTELTYKMFSEDMHEDIKAFLVPPVSLEAVDVANAVLYALQTPPYVQVKELTLLPTQQVEQVDNTSA